MAHKQSPIASSEFVGRVSLYRDRLSRTERQITEYLVNHQDEVGDLSIQSLADKIGVGVASIVRLSKTLGYKSYSDMKYQMQNGKLMIDEFDLAITKEDSTNQVKQKVLQFSHNSMERTLLSLDDDTLDKVATAIIHAGKVMIVGVGTASAVARAGASMFMAQGVLAITVEEGMLQLRTAAFLSPGDVLIGISYSGYSKDIGDTMMFAKRAGATTVLITSCADSLLGKYADYELFTVVRNESNSINISATSLGQLSILLVLQTLVQQRRTPRIARCCNTLRGHGNMKYYDHKQEEIHQARVRIVKEENT